MLNAFHSIELNLKPFNYFHTYKKSLKGRDKILIFSQLFSHKSDARTTKCPSVCVSVRLLSKASKNHTYQPHDRPVRHHAF